MKKYVEKIDYGVVSNCCGARILTPDICSDCLEHCQATTTGAWLENTFKDINRMLKDILRALKCR